MTMQRLPGSADDFRKEREKLEPPTPTPDNWGEMIDSYTELQGTLADTREKLWLAQDKAAREKFCYYKTVPEDYQDAEFNIHVKMKSRWVPHFLAMLKDMERLGGIGSSRIVSFMSDGDGDFRPRFVFHDDAPADGKPVKDDDGHKLYDAG